MKVTTKICSLWNAVFHFLDCYLSSPRGLLIVLVVITCFKLTKQHRRIKDNEQWRLLVDDVRGTFSDMTTRYFGFCNNGEVFCIE